MTVGIYSYKKKEMTEKWGNEIISRGFSSCSEKRAKEQQKTEAV